MNDKWTERLKTLKDLDTSWGIVGLCILILVLTYMMMLDDQADDAREQREYQQIQQRLDEIIQSHPSK